jgi:hypothetical protein
MVNPPDRAFPQQDMGTGSVTAKASPSLTSGNNPAIPRPE